MSESIKLTPAQALRVIEPVVVGGLPALLAAIQKRLPQGDQPSSVLAATATVAGETHGAHIDAASWYSISDVSQILPWTPRTLEAWRSAGKGPAWSRVGGRILYRGEDLLRFLEAGRQPGPKERRAARARRQG